MAATFDEIILSNGSLLTDEELQQLIEVCNSQRDERSVLNGDVDFDKGKSSYSATYYCTQQRARLYVDLTPEEAAASMAGQRPAAIPPDTGYRVYPRSSANRNSRTKEPKQFKFMRLSNDRLGNVRWRLSQLKGTINKSNVIDLPTAAMVVDKLQAEVDDLRKTYEEAAKALIKRVNKKAGIV